MSNAISNMASRGILVGASTIDRTAWETAISRLVEAEAAYQAHEPRCDAAIARYEAKKTAPPECAVYLDPAELGEEGEPVRIELASFDGPRDLMRRDNIANSLLGSKYRELLARYDIWKASDDALRQRCGLTAAYAEAGRLSDAVNDAFDALMWTPAPDHQALARKLGHVLIDKDDRWNEIIMDDVKRLLGESG